MPRSNNRRSVAKPTPAPPKPEPWPDVVREGPTGEQEPSTTSTVRESERRSQNSRIIESLFEDFTSAEIVVFSSYQGIDTRSLERIRHEVGEFGKWSVVRNSLAEIAARRAGLKDLRLTGDTALGFFKQDDAPAAAKVLSGLEKQHPKLVLKGGIETIGQEYLSAQEVRALGSIGSREVLLSTFARDLRLLISTPASVARTSLTKPIVSMSRLTDRMNE